MNLSNLMNVLKWKRHILRYPAATLAPILLAWCGLVAFAPASQATSLWGVATYAANPDLGYGCGVSAGYNSASGPSGSFSGGSVGCTGGYSNNQTAPGQVSATSKANIYQSVPPCCGINHQINDSSSMSATADLPTGQLHLYASDANNIGKVGADCCVADAHYFDTLHLTVAGAQPTTVTTITAHFYFDGTATNPQYMYIPPYNRANNDETAFGLGGNLMDFQYSYNDGSPILQCSGNSNWTVQSCTQEAFLATEAFQITGSSADVPIYVGLEIWSNTDDTADYSNTAGVVLSLPSNVSFTSASGAFLTAQTSAVPEASTSWLALGGLALLAIGRWRRVLR